MLDVNTSKNVEVTISLDGTKIWINNDGQCVFRLQINDGGELLLIDERRSSRGRFRVQDDE